MAKRFVLDFFFFLPTLKNRSAERDVPPSVNEYRVTPGVNFVFYRYYGMVIR